MAWTYLAESEETLWHFENGSIQLPIVKEIDTRKLSYCHECGKACFLQDLSGMMCPHCVDTCCLTSISSLGAFHARTSALQARAQDWAESAADFSSRSFAWPKKSSPRSYSLKTSQLSGLEDWTVLSKNLPRSGMTFGGRCYPLKKLERITNGSAGSAWLPTPSASSYGSNKGGAAGRVGTAGPSLETMARKGMWPTPTARDHFPPHSKEYIEKKIAQGHGMANLNDAVSGNHPRWPTPRAADGTKNVRSLEGALKECERKGGPQDLSTAVRLWPTPTIYGNHNAPKKGTARGTGLSTAVKRWPTPTNSMVTMADMEQARFSGNSGSRPSYKDVSGGSLNPMWVEWLMGFPLGWTVLHDSVTPWFLSKRGKRSKS